MTLLDASFVSLFHVKCSQSPSASVGVMAAQTFEAKVLSLLEALVDDSKGGSFREERKGYAGSKGTLKDRRKDEVKREAYPRRMPT